MSCAYACAYGIIKYLQGQGASTEDPQACHTVNRRAEVKIIRIVDTDWYT